MSDVWEELKLHEQCPDDLFMLLYPDFVKALRVSPPQQTIFDTSNDPGLAKQAFECAKACDFHSDARVACFLENAYLTIDEVGSQDLSNRYYELVDAFLQRYNLRFRLSRPFRLNPTVPGMFASFMDEITGSSKDDPHLRELLTEFQEAVARLRQSRDSLNLKTCILTATNYAEGMARSYPGRREPHLALFAVS